MSIANEMETIRYYLRDPEGKIWGNELIFGLYNQAQNELQQRTRIFEGITNIHIPPRWQGSYTHDWEAGLLPGSQHYQCLRTQGNNFVTCFHWEVQQNYGVAAPDVGEKGYAYTHPWEAFVNVTPNKPPSYAFPDDMHEVKQMFYDEQPLLPENSKRMMETDPSWDTRSSTPVTYQVDSFVENQFQIHLRPATITWDDDAGSGMVTSVEDDTTNEETGIVTLSTGRYVDDETGIAIEAITDANNITLFYDVQPKDIEGLASPTYSPAYMQKFIRYRVLELAYGANTEGMNKNLSAFWNMRAVLGLDVVMRFRGNRYKDRDYQMTTKQGTHSRTFRHAKLPDAYPSISHINR
jgi:hypothetical protein